MTMQRRQFLRFAAGGIALAVLPLPACTTSGPPVIEGNAGPIAISDDGTRFEVVPDRHQIIITSPDGRTRTVGRLGRERGELNYPVAIAMSGGLAYVVDLGNHRVQAFDEDGTCQVIITSDELVYPSGIAAYGDQLFVATQGRIVEVTPYGDIVRRLATDPSMRPSKLAMIDDHLLVTDVGSRQIVELRRNGSLVRRYPGEWVVPSGVATNGSTIYVADSSRDELVMFDRDARPIGTLPLGAAPRHIAFAADGSLYVA